MQRDAARPLLEVASLAAGYRRLQVLWDVNLVIHEHESVVLLGANGAGKTTLLKAIMSVDAGKRCTAPRLFRFKIIRATTDAGQKGRVGPLSAI